MVDMYKLFITLCLVAIVPTLHANTLNNDSSSDEHHVKELDEYWKEREAIAEKFNKEAYSVDPYEVTNNLSLTVNQSMIGNENKRRNLLGVGIGIGLRIGIKRDECMATNPIDKCWMCDPNWEQNRQRLADCALGFGRRTTGGKGGPIYVVTDSSDNDLVNPKPGTLRYAVTRTGPLWITFARSMGIRLSQELIMTSDKTIDGRGVDVLIANGSGFTLQFIKNVIIHGIRIYNIFPGQGGFIRDSETHFGHRTRSDGDGISIYGSSNIWIDHVTIRKTSDGMIDAIMGSTAVTVSNCRFSFHDKVLLFGAADFHTQDDVMQITVAFNRFSKSLVQRMPRCRRGFFHVVNNDYNRWKMYAIGGSMHPTIISEGNRFVAPDDLNAKQVTKREMALESEWMKWNWRSINDVFENGAFFNGSGTGLLHIPAPNEMMIKARHGSFAEMLTRLSGSLQCTPRKFCRPSIY